MSSVTTRTIGIDEIVFRADLYPRLKPDPQTIKRYRDAIELLPLPVVASLADGGEDIVPNVLVDGYHGWQARKAEKVAEIDVHDLGALSAMQILEESIRSNASHGHQLSQKDKQTLVERLWDDLDIEDETERQRHLVALFSVNERTMQRWTKEIREEREKVLKRRAWALYELEHFALSLPEGWKRWTQDAIAEELGIDQATVARWLMQMRQMAEMHKEPDSLQVYDLWQFQQARGDSTYFGKLPPQVIENVLWLYTEPEQSVFDPFAGGGTTVLSAIPMRRKVWASDLEPSDLTLPIVKHDVLEGWPEAAPAEVDLIFLDPPYWKQARGQYPEHPSQLGEMELSEFMEAWDSVIASMAEHLVSGGRLAYIVSPTQEQWRVVDHALAMRDACLSRGLEQIRRIIVPYQSEQTHGGHVTKAIEARNLLARYRDLIVFEKP